MRILFICTTTNQIVNFRKGLIERFQADGCEVGAVAFDDENTEINRAEIARRGVRFFTIDDSGRGLNPFKALSLKSRYVKILKEFAPDVVFTFMMKPNIFGVLAAEKSGVKNIFSMVEGAGDVFINNGLKWRAIRAVVCRLYKKAFKRSEKVFFLNPDDMAEFTARKLVKNTQCEISDGIGVDLEKFEQKPIKNRRTFLMIARMLKSKGVIEYCKAARAVKEAYPDAVFNYIGEEGTVKLSDIQEYIDDGSVNYLGITRDVRPYIEDCGVYVLPSYREGMPMSVMEAEAVGRAVITTNAVGCRSAVEDGANGYKVEVGNVKQLKEAVLRFLENPESVDVMGENSRRLAEKRFDKNVVNDRIAKTVFGCCGAKEDDE